MRKSIALVAVLAICLGLAWADRPSPTQEDTPQMMGQIARGAFDPVPAMPSRAQAIPPVAAPLDGGASAVEGIRSPAGTRGSTWNVPGDYATIQAAITAPTTLDGDTIVVAAGTYVETGQIVINKSLAIIGDPANMPVIKPAQDTGGAGDARGWWLVNAGKALSLRYLILDGDAPTHNVHTGIRSWGTVDVRDCVLRNNVYPDYDGRGIGPYAGSANIVQRVTFQNMGRLGMLVYGTGVYATVDQCTYTGKGNGDWLDYGVEFGGGGGGTVTNSTFTACTGVASTDGSISAGILITTYYGAGSAGTLLGNVFTGNTTGVAVGYDTSDTSTVVAHYNDFAGNVSYAITSTNPAIDGEKNWWGTTDAAAIATLVSASVDHTPFLLTDQIRTAFGGNRLATLQNTDGGWGWPLTGTSAPNTLGPIAMGLAKAYRATGDPDVRAALSDAGAYLLTKTNNFSPSDGYLAAELDRIFGGTTYVNHLNTNFYGPLAGGTYNRNGAGTLYDTAAYVNSVRTARANQGIPNIAAWDLGMGLVAAASCGVTGTELATWIAGVEAEINELDGSDYYDVIGLAGALFGLAFVDAEFDPTSGEHAAASSLTDLASILATYQISASGGFAWNRDYVIPYADNETTQETGYAILALETVGGYDAATLAAKNWLLTKQLPTGGWDDYVGDTSENNEITGEALWGVWANGPATLTLVPDDECYATGDIVTVEIWMNDVPQAIVGGQFFLQYDKNTLDFQSATYGDTPFTQELYEVVNESAGTIDYSVNAPWGDPGVSGTKKMAVLTFTALAPICSATDLITFRPHDPPTRLSDAFGNAVYPDLVALDVIDTEAPTITCPANVTVECDASTAPANTGSATAIDNCDPAPAITHADVANLTGCDGTGTITRTWIATDACGNVSQCVQIITVVDTTAPVITCPADVTVECDASTAPTNTGSATAIDNCDPAPVISYADAVNLTGCDGTGTITRTWTATDACGNLSQCIQTITVVDTTAPVITCPANVSVNADAGTCAAVLDPGAATATDNCDADVTVMGMRSDSLPLTDPYPAGTTTITWTATDDCGNSDTCDQTITVNGENELLVSVQLSPTMVAGPITRCITFELWTCPGTAPAATVDAVMTFTNGQSGSVTVLVPCGDYTCITARDSLHTLRRTDEAFTKVGTKWVADFTGDPSTSGDWLIGGNLNDDKWIDILDFGVFSWKWNTAPGANTTCDTPYPHADIDGDGSVQIGDFTFIQGNFLKSHEANCCGQPGFRDDAAPVTRISVDDLYTQGLGELAAGDFNGDGWLDEEDMVAFANGTGPVVRTGDLNCDGVVNFGDINPFVQAITSPAAWAETYPGCSVLNADVNEDGVVNFADINPFVTLLQQQ